MVMSEAKKIVVLMMCEYGDQVLSYQDVIDLFNYTFLNRAPI